MPLISGNWNFFQEENLVKTKINGHPKVQCLVNMADELELCSQATTDFAWSSKKHVALHYGGLCIFCWLILDAFRQVLLSVRLTRNKYFLELTCLIFQKVLIVERTPFQSLYIHITFFGWRPAFGVVGGGTFHLPNNLLHSTLLYSIHFSSPITVFFF